MTTTPHVSGSHTKWVVTAFSAGVLALLAFLAGTTHNRIVAVGSQNTMLSTENDKKIAVMQTELKNMHKTMLDAVTQLEEIETTQKEILSAMRK